MSGEKQRTATGDLKAARMVSGDTAAKPKMSILPLVGLTYGVRPIEYGADKYARGNYHAPPPPALDADPQLAAVKRFLGYLDAAGRHIVETTDAINRALGSGGDLLAACRVVDDKMSGGFPPSMLPHLSHAIASLLIGVTCAADDGLLDKDPGQPWKALLAAAKPDSAIEDRKADPSSERRRIATLRKVRATRRAK